jgi:hypothetical protein
MKGHQDAWQQRRQRPGEGLKSRGHRTGMRCRLQRRRRCFE